ncbi:MAG: peptide deformylase [Patescibacteria group bacterium]|nr:peptide deformylase [Patescibacteria group bacterium]MBU1870574.1 peptide deformylase [Patescibacteria group bacterium]
MIKILPIIIAPNPILRKKSIEIDFKKISIDKIKKLCSAMYATIIKADGVGLAAPQIGKNIQLIVLHTQNGQLNFLNPKIIKKSWTKILDNEGCLSVPEIYSQVKRYKNITCQYFDETGKKLILNAEGLLARVIQHEIDHLNGILFIDKAIKAKNYG